MVNRGRKPGRTRILTDTPEKNEIELKKKKVRKLELEAPALLKKKNHLVYKSNTHIQDSSSSDDEEPVLNDSSDDEIFEPEAPETDFDFSAENIESGDFLLIKFATKTAIVHYVGRVENEINSEYEISFLRKRGRGYVFPNVLDISNVSKEDVVLKLPLPCKSGGSDRLFSIYSFEIDLSSFSNLR